MKLRNNILGAGLWAIAAGASALSLGASRGAVVLGSSLDLTFDVQPDTGSDVASSCVAATVKSGDAQLSESKVFVTPLPETSGRTGVRVQASVAIDEPIVQVTADSGLRGPGDPYLHFLCRPSADGTAQRCSSWAASDGDHSIAHHSTDSGGCARLKFPPTG